MRLTFVKITSTQYIAQCFLSLHLHRLAWFQHQIGCFLQFSKSLLVLIKVLGFHEKKFPITIYGSFSSCYWRHSANHRCIQQTPPPLVSSHGLEFAYLSRVGVARDLRRCSLPTRVRENTCRRVRQNTIKSYAYNSTDIHLTNKYENKLLNFCTRHLLDAFTCVFAALFFLSY